MEARNNRTFWTLALLVCLVSIATCQDEGSPARAGVGMTLDQICAYCCYVNWWECIQIYCFNGDCGRSIIPYQPDWFTPEGLRTMFWTVTRELIVRKKLGLYPYARDQGLSGDEDS